MNRKCVCLEVMGRDPAKTPVIVHLLGCPEDSWAKEYDALPWYRRLFRKSPHKTYAYWLRP
jgi:hypothetical protein